MRRLLLLFLMIALPCGVFSSREQILTEYFPSSVVIEREGGMYYSISEGNEERYRAFFSEEFSSVAGYAGPVKMLLITDPQVSQISEIIILVHRETPAFMRMVEKAGVLDQLKSYDVPSLLEDPSVDTVSGATFTSRAIIKGVLETLTAASTTDLPQDEGPSPTLDLLLLLGSIVVLGVVSIGVFTRKAAVKYLGLVMYLGFFPVFMGRLLSLEYVIKYLPAPVILTPLGIVTAFVLILSFFKNRPYCYNMCPIGFLSQMGCRIKSKKCTFRDNRLMRISAFLLINILYLLGFVYLAVFPFQAFVRPYLPLKIGIIVGFAVISVFLPYIWCNNLCPLGTLFSLQYDLGRMVKGVFRKKG